MIAVCLNRHGSKFLMANCKRFWVAWEQSSRLFLNLQYLSQYLESRRCIIKLISSTNLFKWIGLFLSFPHYLGSTVRLYLSIYKFMCLFFKLCFLKCSLIIRIGRNCLDRLNVSRELFTKVQIINMFF